MHPETFSHNTELQWLDLERNNITDIQCSAVGNISTLQHLDVSHNNSNSVHSDTFQHNVELQFLDLQCNRITDIDPSTFRHQPKLISLYMSNNEIRSIKQDTFIHNRKLQSIYLAYNSITDIHLLTFRNNAKLVQSDTSQNNINFINKDTFIYNVQLTLNPLTWKIWWAPNNTSRWRMGFNSAFKGLRNILLKGNSITDIHPNTFWNKRKLKYLYMFKTKFPPKASLLWRSGGACEVIRPWELCWQ